MKDPNSRAAYDRYGEEGMKKVPGAGGKTGEDDDMFAAMFGMGKMKGPKKTRSLIHPLKCTLEDLYNGKNSRIRINKLT